MLFPPLDTPKKEKGNALWAETAKVAVDVIAEMITREYRIRNWRDVVHSRRLPVIKRTRAKFSIPEALNRVFLGANAIKMAPEF